MCRTTVYLYSKTPHAHLVTFFLKIFTPSLITYVINIFYDLLTLVITQVIVIPSAAQRLEHYNLTRGEHDTGNSLLLDLRQKQSRSKRHGC